MATLDTFGFKARKSRTLTKVTPSKLIERSNSSFIVPVDIKPLITTSVAHKRKHSTKSQQQQTSIKSYFNKEEEEVNEQDEGPVITCVIKKHITTAEMWKILETEYTSIIPAPKVSTTINKRRAIEVEKRTSPLKRQRTMDSLSEFMNRHLKVTEDTCFETIVEKEQEEDEILIRPIKRFTAAESELLLCQIAQDFIIPF